MNTEIFTRCLQAIEHACTRFKTPIVTLYAQEHSTPFHILITTLLSLRTKDNTTAQASTRLFTHARTPEKMLTLSQDRIAELIYPVGFYNTKAKQIHSICHVLLERHNKQVPDTLEGLLALKGVGRKTANLVLALGYGQAAICVDTHVHRICNRLGFLQTRNPFETEMELRKKLNPTYWSKINTLLVTYGQNICKPIAPLCTNCSIRIDCPKLGVAQKGNP